ncbi:MAG TPA: formate--tetrahydrofolate ligase [Caldisericia bacterium]|nr:formate--tetrahydrofolate ligase [Caldisericia bacterium]
MKSDIEIQKETPLLAIEEIASKLNLGKQDIELYGNYKCKIAYSKLKHLRKKPDSKLVLVTAISPNPAGVGKTTNLIGIVDALNQLGKKAIAALREPSLGPTLGMKGGAAGGGYAQVAPIEDINLHFTGDFHAVSYANNFLLSVVDNHVYYGNSLNLDYRDIKFKRTIDLDDRSLREIMSSMGFKNGFPRMDGFVITAASELMAILTMSRDIKDLKERLGRILVGYTFDNQPLFASTFDAHEAMAVLLKDAIKPNLVQTLEHNPAIIHSGPFGNIATGTSSIISIQACLGLADIVVTEAGFGADLGAEKFFDIVCREGGFEPSLVVIMASIQALKYYGGVSISQLKAENIEAIKLGTDNLKTHIENLQLFHLPVIVGLNRFPSDTDKEISHTLSWIEQKLKCKCFLTEPYTKGGKGCLDIAEEIINTQGQTEQKFHYLYPLKLNPQEKIKTIAKKIYRAREVEFSKKALKDLERIESFGFSRLPVCMAKTQYSFSDDPKIINRKKPYDIHIDEIRLSAGAGYIVPIAGNMMTMPGLPMKPNSSKFFIDLEGNISGLE